MQVGRTRSKRHIPVWIAILWLAAARLLFAAEYHGQVLLNGLPVPGASVTATQDKTSITVITDERGIYSFPDLAVGNWNIEVQMSGFATAKQAVSITANTPPGEWRLTMLPVDQVMSQAKASATETASSKDIPPPGTRSGAGRIRRLAHQRQRE